MWELENRFSFLKRKCKFRSSFRTPCCANFDLLKKFLVTKKEGVFVNIHIYFQNIRIIIASKNHWFASWCILTPSPVFSAYTLTIIISHTYFYWLQFKTQYFSSFHMFNLYNNSAPPPFHTLKKCWSMPYQNSIS